MDFDSQNTIGTRLAALSTYSGTAPVAIEDRKRAILEQVHRKIATLAPHVKTCTITVDSDGFADFVFVLEATVAALETCGYKCTGPDGHDRYQKRRGSDSYGILLTRQPAIDGPVEGGAWHVFLRLVRAAWNVSETDSRDDDTISAMAYVFCTVYMYCWLAWDADHTIGVSVASPVASMWTCNAKCVEWTGESATVLLRRACICHVECCLAWLVDMVYVYSSYIHTAFAHARYTLGISVDDHTRDAAIAFAATRHVTAPLAFSIIVCLITSVCWKLWSSARRRMIVVSALSTFFVFRDANDIVYDIRHAISNNFFPVFFGGVSLVCMWLLPRIASALKRIIQEFWAISPAPGHAVDAAVDL